MDSDEGSAPSPSPPPPSGAPPTLPPPLPARPHKPRQATPPSTPPPTRPDPSRSPEDAPEPDHALHVPGTAPHGPERENVGGVVADEEDEEMSQQMTQSYSEISFRSGPVSPEHEAAAQSLPTAALDCLRLGEHSGRRPATLPCDRSLTRPFQPFAGPLDLEGTVHVEGNMTHFVTEDLEYKIKLSSPVARKSVGGGGGGGGGGGETPPPFPGGSRGGTPSSLYRQMVLGGGGGPQHQQQHQQQQQQLDAGLLNDLELEAQRMATSVDSLTESLCGILHSVSSITADNVDVYKNVVGKMSDAMDGNIKSMYTMMAKAEEVTQAMRAVQAHAARVKEIRRLVDLFETYV